ncbi:MAG: hypothetical protein OEM76_08070 [Gammaproteobacteria bacterium]|nr:hypothetical protein [Gammaproteobacteria bacterium]
MAKKQSQKRTAAGDEVDGNVDKIREILFGGQMRDYEGRFADLEKRLSQRIDRMDTEFEKRIERLNTYAKREVDRLGERLKAERTDRLADAKSGSRELKDLTQQVEAWFGEVEDRIEVESKELRDSLHEKNEELAALITETRDHLNAALSNETRELADTMLAREDLAGLLSEVALRLKNDFKLPKG